MSTYFIYTTIGLGLSFFMYQLFLKRNKSFVFNRYYLLITIIFALIAPFLQIDTSYNPLTTSGYSPANILTEKEEIIEKIKFMTVETIKANSAEELLSISLKAIYLFVLLILLIRFIINLKNLVELPKRNPKTTEGYLNIVLLEQETVPFSFFHNFFVNKSQFQNGEVTKTIIKHEQVHSREFHSLDILFIEFISCLLWFNPFIHLYKKLISENHEFIVDNAVINEGLDAKEYSNEIIKSASKLNPPQFASSFSYIETKNRIIMISKMKSNTFSGAIRIFSVLILSGTILALSSFRYVGHSDPFVVIIDAGHGGNDPGAHQGGLNEKEIMLNISKKVASFSEKREIKVLLTRTKDELITLEDRVNFINTQNPDLVLSLHINFAEDINKRGLESYH